jgi:hypothetical protein
MNRAFLLAIVFWLLSEIVHGTGYDVKTSSIIDQPGIEVLGDYNGSWYVIGFEAGGTLNKPPRYKLFKYAAGFPTCKISSLYPSFGDKTLYLKSALINGKISVFYAVCEKWAEEKDLLDNREGHRQMAQVYRIDYDPNTLEQTAEPKQIFNEADDKFAASGIEITHSPDKSKVAVLVKCYYRQQKYKLILTGGQTGEVYSKVFDWKDLKENLRFQDITVANNGQVYIQTKVRDDIISITQPAKDKKVPLYYFFSVDKDGGNPHRAEIFDPVAKGICPDQPSISALNSGELLIAYNYRNDAKSPVVKGFSVCKYNNELALVSKKDITADLKLIQAANVGGGKRTDGFINTEIRKVLPLEGANFMIMQETRQIAENTDKTQPARHEHSCLYTYFFDDKLELKKSHAIPKKQISTTVGYAFSAQVYNRGNEVYLFHNDDWETDDENGINLFCSRFPAGGGEPETRKIIHTSDNFLTSMEHIYGTANGKLLFTEEKAVEFAGVSREVKLLEVTVK